VSIDQRDPRPLYEQLAAILRAQIESGEVTYKLPSESYLQQHYQVSRGVVRHAIEVLTAEGLVYTIMARGTFIGRPPTARGQRS
jgi:DNA-binding GntR family transcriptional regulator